MCFSALASFGTATALSCLGIVTLKQINSKEEILFASFPCLFALQQTCEGLIWISKEDRVITFGTYGFLLFATFLWLILSPLSIYLLENDIKRKRILLGLTVTGMLLGIYLFGSIIDQGIEPQIFSGNLFYDLRFIPFYEVCKYLYLTVISLPFWISSNSSLKLFGALIIGSFIVAQVLFQITFVSVWCFFAALLSGFIFYILKDLSIKISEVPEVKTVENDF